MEVVLSGGNRQWSREGSQCSVIFTAFPQWLTHNMGGLAWKVDLFLNIILNYNYYEIL